jgi:parallel beta-helix repeat protein
MFHSGVGGTLKNGTNDPRRMSFGPARYAIVALAILALSLNGANAVATPPVHPGSSPHAFYQGQVIIFANGALSQPTAPIHVSGNTYTLTSRFNGSIVDDRNGSVLDGAGFTLNVTPRASVGISVSNDTIVTVQNFKIINASVGVWGAYDRAVTISGNRLNASLWGIELANSARTQITGNNLSGFAGIAVNESTDLTIAHNNLTADTQFGAFGWDDTEVNLTGNSLGAVYESNGYYSSGAFFHGGGNFSFYQNTAHLQTILGQSVSGIGVEEASGPVRIIDNTVIDGYYGAYVWYATDVWVQGNTFTNSPDCAIYPYGSTDLWIDHNDANGSYYAVYLDVDDYTWVDGLTDVGGADPYYVGFSSYSFATDIYAPDASDTGIYYSYAWDASTTWSNFSYAEDYGVYSDGNANTSVSYTDLSHAVEYGVYADDNINETYSHDLLDYAGEEYYGAYLEDDTNETFVSDNLSQNSYGIYAEYVTGLTVLNSNLTFSYDDGVYWEYGSQLTIKDSNLSWGEGYGLDDYESSNAVLDDVNASYFTGEEATGLYIEYDYGTVAINGLVAWDDYYGVYGEANLFFTTNSNFTADEYGIYGEYCYAADVSGSSFFDNYEGWYDYESIILNSWNNVYRDNYYGLYAEEELNASSWNDLYVYNEYGAYLEEQYGVGYAANDQFAADYYPIYFYEENLIDFLSSNISGLQGEYGVYVYDLYGAGTISDIQAIGTDLWGLVVEGALDLTVSGSSFRGSPEGAIWADDVYNARFVGNDLSFSRYGLQLGNTTATVLDGNLFDGDQWAFASNFSVGNWYYHNDFVNDGGYTFLGGEYPNWFNASLPIGGNFWSNYTATSSSNGIGSPPYPVAGTLEDYLPLANSWATYTVTFVATGLPAGSPWTITLNGQAQTAMTGSIVYTQVNGAFTPYTWTLTPIAGWVSSVWSGGGSFDATDQVIDLDFSPFTYQTTFQETGLPSGTSWTVTSGSQTVPSTGNELNLTLTNGTHSWTLSAVPGYVASVSSGSVSVVGNAPTPTVITFTPFTFVLTFKETGLPAGTIWGVALDSLPWTGTNLTYEAYAAANGTVTYSVSPVAGYTVSSPSGSVTIQGASVTVNLVFTPRVAPTYAVSFTESNLPSNTPWSVLIDGTTLTGSGTTLSTSLSNQSYTYSVGVPTGYSASPAAGTVIVAGVDQTVNVVFTSTTVPPPTTFAVTFSVTGLPNGDLWSVSIGGATTGVPSGSYTTDLANGTYTYSVTPPTGYTATPSGGNILVKGVAQTVTITITQTPTSGASTNGFTTTEEGLLSGLLLLVLIAAAGWLLYMRSRAKSTKTPPPAAPSSEKETEPAEEETPAPTPPAETPATAEPTSAPTGDAPAESAEKPAS